MGGAESEVVVGWVLVMCPRVVFTLRTFLKTSRLQPDDGPWQRGEPKLGLPSSRARRFRAFRNQRNNCPIGTVVHFYLRNSLRLQASTSEQLSG